MTTLTQSTTSKAQICSSAHNRTLDAIVGILTLILVIGLFKL